MQNKTEKMILSLLLAIALMIGSIPFGNVSAYASTESVDNKIAAHADTEETRSADGIAPLAASDYDPEAVTVINRLIDNNGLKAAKNDPDNWSFATWDTSVPKKLTVLDVSLSNLSGVVDISGLTSLTELYCDNNSLTKLDVSGCAALEALFCNDNNLMELNLSGCTALWFSLLNNQSPSLYLMESAPEQYSLAIPLNNPTFTNSSISYADGVLKSTSSVVTNTNFTMETGLPGKTLSGRMHLAYGPAPTPITADFTDPNFLAEVRWYLRRPHGEIYAEDAVAIMSLNLRACNISSLAGIQHFPALRTLNCSENNLTALDVSCLLNLEELFCDNNSLEELQVSGLSKLKRLDCQKNRLTALDLSSCGNLNSFDGSGQSLPLMLSRNAEGKYKYTISLNAPTFTNPTIDYDDGALNAESTAAASTDFTVETGRAGKVLSGTMKLRYADVPITADFTDPNFLAEVRSTVGVPTGEIYASDVAGISRLIVDEKSIASLAGIEHFTSLTVLSCYNNQLTSLDVRGLSLLRELYCFGNQLTSLDVSGLDQLTDLGLANNRLTSLDVSSLDSLAYLDCFGNQLTSLDVSSLRNLGELYCKNNQLSVLNVAGLNKLIGLDCATNHLTSLNVSGLSGLRSLNCSYNYMTDTSAVTGRSIPWDGSYFVFEPQRIPPSFGITVTGGTADKATAKVGGTVTITANTAPARQRFKEWSISPAVSFVNGTSLKSAIAKFTMPHQQVTATAVYEEAPVTDDFTDPKFLEAVRNAINKPVGDIYASDLSGITILNVENKNIENLAGIQHFTALRILICDNNQLTTLDLSSLSNLTMLACSGNRLISLNVSGLGNLTYLYCYDNELTSLNVSGLGSLVLLNCAGNKLTTLHVSGLGSLKELKCHENEMMVLDVSGLDSLVSLNCAYNQLTALNVSGLLSLQGLNCPYNRLTTLDVSGLSNLGYFDCSYNYMPSTSAVTGQSISWDGSSFIFEPQRINIVTVHNGTGSGNYAQGDTVTITANAAPDGMIFDKWSSNDGVTFANESSMSTTFIMPGKNVTVMATFKSGYMFRTLTDRTTGIIVSGNISEGAALAVTDLALGDSAAGNAIRVRMNDNDYAFIIGKNITLSGSFTGMLTVTIPVGAQYNGETVTILHAKQDGTLETYTATVMNGKVTFDVTSLSPFAVFLKDGLDDIPNTGDVGTSFIWWILLAMSGAGLMTLMLIKKKALRKRGQTNTR